MAEFKGLNVNNVQLSGRLTGAPRLAYSPIQKRPKASFSVAHTRRFKKPDGTWDEKATYVNVECWDRLAEWIGDPRNFGVGSPIYLEGSIEFDQWTDQKTQQRRTRVYVLARRIQQLTKDGASGSSGAQPASSPAPQTHPAGAQAEEQQDDFPF